MTSIPTTTAGPLDSAERAPRRRSGLRFLIWTVGIIVFGGMLISVMLPSLCRSSETANRVKCASNLRQIGQAITLYAQVNGGLYPPSLAVLPGVEDITAEVMVCPSSSDEKSAATDGAGMVADLLSAETNAPGHKNCLSYVYTGQLLTIVTASANTIVAYEPLDNHDGDGTNVLFGDGHVEWEIGKFWPQYAEKSGVQVIPSLRKRP